MARTERSDTQSPVGVGGDVAKYLSNYAQIEEATNRLDTVLTRSRNAEKDVLAVNIGDAYRRVGQGLRSLLPLGIAA